MSTPPWVQLEACPICDSRDLSILRRRTDGIAVLQCAECRMGFVERRPADLRVFYGDEYYQKAGEASAEGYDDYSAVAAHSLAWVPHLLELLPGDRILDVGCADGFLLRQLGSRFKRSGIEVNAAMARRCEAEGIEIIGQDICDPALTSVYGATFDVITAIATVEHLVDLRGALQNIRSLMAPGGIFIFEVPFLSQSHDNGIWFRSSLEHIFYPTIDGLNYVFRDVFGHPPIGGEVNIEEYGSVYVGMVTNAREPTAGLSQLYARAFAGPVAGLDGEKERRFRFFFDVIHAARTSPDLVQLIEDVAPSDLSLALLTRIGFLWWRDTQVRSTLAGTEAAKAFHEQQSSHWQSEAERTEAAKAFHEQQSRNWQSEAEVQTAMNAALKDWIKKVEAARDGHAQRSSLLEEQLNPVKQRILAAEQELAGLQGFWRQLGWRARLKFFLRPGSVAK